MVASGSWKPWSVYLPRLLASTPVPSPPRISFHFRPSRGIFCLHWSPALDLGPPYHGMPQAEAPGLCREEEPGFLFYFQEPHP